MPTVAILDELADRQRIDEFICDRDRRAFRYVFNRQMPCNGFAGFCQGLLLSGFGADRRGDQAGEAILYTGMTLFDDSDAAFAVIL